MKYRLLGGNHAHHGVLYKKGSVVESEVDLCKRFVNKFERLYEAETPPPTIEKKEVGKGRRKAKIRKKGDGESVVDLVAAKARGTDVTNKFTVAEEEGLAVFKRGAWYHVYEGGGLSPLNGKGLKRAQVEPFVQTYLEE